MLRHRQCMVSISLFNPNILNSFFIIYVLNTINLYNIFNLIGTKLVFNMSRGKQFDYLVLLTR